MQTQVQNESIANVIERAKLFGILKYLPDGNLTHAPFSLSPFSISKYDLEEMTLLTSYFNELIIKVSQDWDFLDHYLLPIAKNDPFLQMLIDFRKNEITQGNQFLVQRNDFFLVNNKSTVIQKSTEDRDPNSKSNLRQVELNTVSASFPFLITQLARLHEYLFEQNKLEKIIPNNPVKHLVDTFAIVQKSYGPANSIILIVTQPEESNQFDQIGLEQLIWDRHNIQTIRKSLTEIYENGCLREGHLILNGKTVAITYYRAGYSPDDFKDTRAIKGRQLIEASSTIQVPDLPMHLSGMKKIQQVLTKPEIISRFTTPKIAKILMKTFVKMYSFDEIIETHKGNINAFERASLNPNKYVLKPQREGGGNNFFGKEITKILSKIKKEKQNTYILMEKILTNTHEAILVVNNHSENLSCVSEIGRYGICTAENGFVKSNRDIGYLVRTKSEKINEGGVCAGFACLNSLMNS